VRECIEAYVDLAGHVFKLPNTRILRTTSSKYGAEILEAQLQSVIASRWNAGQGNLNSTDGNTEQLEDPLKEKCCKTFVLALHADVASGVPSRLRSYSSKLDLPTKDCTIWQAARATSAAPTFFDPITFGVPPIRYIDAGIGYNNPSREALIEAARIWPDVKIGCLLSIGTGYQSQAQLKDFPFPKFFGGLRSQYQVAKACVRISTDCERTANQTREDCKRQNVPYFRFNVRQGLENIGLEEYKRVSEVGGCTQEYLCQGETDDSSTLCASHLAEGIMPGKRVGFARLQGIRDT